eukprot:scaffold226444_cov19-Tisochrysis_lutea.AAC.1
MQPQHLICATGCLSAPFPPSRPWHLPSHTHKALRGAHSLIPTCATSAPHLRHWSYPRAIPTLVPLAIATAVAACPRRSSRQQARCGAVGVHAAAGCRHPCLPECVRSKSKVYAPQGHSNCRACAQNCAPCSCTAGGLRSQVACVNSVIPTRDGPSF